MNVVRPPQVPPVVPIKGRGARNNPGFDLEKQRFQERANVRFTRDTASWSTTWSMVLSGGVRSKKDASSNISRLETAGFEADMLEIVGSEEPENGGLNRHTFESQCSKRNYFADKSSKMAHY